MMTAARSSAVTLVERQLAPLRPRPHGGNLFAAWPDVMTGLEGLR
jgi:hypothetical protein